MENPHPQTKVVDSLLYRLGKNFTFYRAFYGEENTDFTKMSVSNAQKELKDIILSVDECVFSVKNKVTGKISTLLIILGNEDSELVADWTVGDDELENVITEFSEYWEK